MPPGLRARPRDPRLIGALVDRIAIDCGSARLTGASAVAAILNAQAYVRSMKCSQGKRRAFLLPGRAGRPGRGKAKNVTLDAQLFYITSPYRTPLASFQIKTLRLGAYYKVALCKIAILMNSRGNCAGPCQPGRTAIDGYPVD
jgi:hypothetical protein